MALYLTAEQLTNFKDYKHQAAKTTLEQFYVDTLLSPIEKAIPKRWSANTVTLIGQVPIALTIFYIWSFSLNPKDKVPDHAIFLAAITTQWFSLFDVMDGMRARRLKCGSPLGRIIDEALDQVSYSSIANTAIYMLRIESPIWLLLFGVVNVPFYTMELRHTVCRHFNMIMGELGPVETELLLTLLYGISSGVFGCEIYERQLSDVFGVDYQIFQNAKLKDFMAGLLVLLMIVFVVDNLTDPIKVNFKETFRLFMPVFVLISFAQISYLLPSFKSEPMIVFFLYQMVFNIILLKLMLYNMSNRPFTQINMQYIYILLPIILYQVFDVSPQIEIFVTRSCFVMAFLEFYLTIYKISRQYVDKEGINFFTIKEEKKD